MQITESKLYEICDLCLQNKEYMWAAKLLGIIFECDFRDSAAYAKEWMKKYENMEL